MARIPENYIPITNEMRRKIMEILTTGISKGSIAREIGFGSPNSGNINRILDTNQTINSDMAKEIDRFHNELKEKGQI